MTIKKQLTYLIETTTNSVHEYPLVLNVINNPKKQMYIIHKALKQQLVESRQGTAHTKTRSEVRGGGRKPWKQKGTGRARAGSIRSPLWRGGGVIFGPKNKIYKSKINKKEKKLAIQTLIYNKFPKTLIINDFINNLESPNTKTIVKQLMNIDININKNQRILLIVAQKNTTMYLSMRNLANIELITANNINIVSLLKAKKILITVDALTIISKIYNE
uniref:Large ribosomal subunit protein uL4c n=1 Tax=Cryptopleura ramosa TaxID=131094 RepID=A0A4D6WQA9_9FLOR|nr:ribosomal protein L4 [Cryptopleura ramosa]